LASSPFIIHTMSTQVGWDIDTTGNPNLECVFENSTTFDQYAAAYIHAYTLKNWIYPRPIDCYRKPTGPIIEAVEQFCRDCIAQPEKRDLIAFYMAVDLEDEDPDDEEPSVHAVLLLVDYNAGVYHVYDPSGFYCIGGGYRSKKFFDMLSSVPTLSVMKLNNSPDTVCCPYIAPHSMWGRGKKRADDGICFFWSLYMLYKVGRGEQADPKLDIYGAKCRCEDLGDQYKSINREACDFYNSVLEFRAKLNYRYAEEYGLVHDDPNYDMNVRRGKNRDQELIMAISADIVEEFVTSVSRGQFEIDSGSDKEYFSSYYQGVRTRKRRR